MRSTDCFVYRPSSYRAVNTFHLGYKTQSVYAVSGTSRCLFSDKYKTHKYSAGRKYSCWMLNCWCITWPEGFKRLTSLVFKNCEVLTEMGLIISLSDESEALHVPNEMQSWITQSCIIKLFTFFDRNLECNSGTHETNCVPIRGATGGGLIVAWIINIVEV